jgi:heme/copper-type cytochrome/quinol oxidase subunit 2
MASEFVKPDASVEVSVKPARRRRIGWGIWLVYLGCAGLWAGSYLHNLGAILYSLFVVVGAVGLVLLGTIIIAWHQRQQRSEAERAAELEQDQRLAMLNKWSR